MIRLALALLLLASPAFAADSVWALYADGRYAEAMKAGEASHNGADLALAARAALADATLRDTPCMGCLKHAEADARLAIAADPALSDPQVWLAASLGYQSRITGVMRARWNNVPAQAKAALDAAVRDDPKNPFAVSALGGWNIEVVRGGGGYLARLLYGASEAEGLALYDQAVKLAPGNVAVRYQIALSLAGYNLDRYRARVAAELDAAIRATPQTAYEKAIQARAIALSSLLKKDDRIGMDGRVRAFQGYP